MEIFEILLIVAAAVNFVLLLIVIQKSGGREAEDRTEALRQSINETTQTSVKNLGELLLVNQKNTDVMQMGKIGDMDKNMTEKQEKMNQTLVNSMTQMEVRLKTLETVNEQKLENMRTTMEKRLTSIQEDNHKQLDDMRRVVDEKLQKTLEDKMNQSFKMVSERLEQVYKGLGEMQTLASGVGDLKKVLSNVKTRGILGEIQLGAILEEILTHEQYETNVATIPNSRNVVEYAIKMPIEDEGYIYLPIDSKFPGDTYAALQDAYDSGEPERVREAAAVLSARIKSSAKDIHEKYVEVPYTTEFAIMFLPFEGLYAEVVNRGLVEVLQREYKINVAGPSTMAALLNSLQMGFRAVAIQKRSLEAWQVLSAVKSEFDSFARVLENTQSRINQANKELDKLVGVRTRAIQRKLRHVEKLDNPAEIAAILPDLAELESEEAE